MLYVCALPDTFAGERLRVDLRLPCHRYCITIPFTQIYPSLPTEHSYREEWVTTPYLGRGRYCPMPPHPHPMGVGTVGKSIPEPGREPCHPHTYRATFPT